MATSLIAELDEQRRDALVDYYLGQIIPSAETSAPPTIITPEDLYEYLLIDNQVSAQVETSRVAQAIASIQQYIHAIFNGMEPGYSDGFDTEYLQLWREGISEYSVWAGYQMIEDYPENYIDPTLRLTKTEQFKELELDLGQSRITVDSVQAALKSYLNKFEVVSNLSVVSGYIDSIDYKKGNYYFLGRQRVEPFSHYWRKAIIDLDDSSSHVSASVWTEWKKIDAAFSASVSHARLVVIEGRVHIIWVESSKPQVDEEGQRTGLYINAVNMSYKQLNDTWSPPTTLFTVLSDTVDVHDSYDSDGRLVSAYSFSTMVDVRDSAMAPSLIVCFYKRNINSTVEQAIRSQDIYLKAYDVFFNDMYLSSAAQAELYTVAAQVANNPARLLTPVDGVKQSDDKSQVEEWGVEKVFWDTESNLNYSGALSQTLSFSATLHGAVGGERYFNIQGFCSARRNAENGFWVKLESSEHKIPGGPNAPMGYYGMIDVMGQVNGGFVGRVMFGSVYNMSGMGFSGVWEMNGVTIGTVADNGYGDMSGGRYSRVAYAQLDLSYDDFKHLSEAAIKGGAGVSFTLTSGRKEVIVPAGDNNNSEALSGPVVETFDFSYVSNLSQAATAPQHLGSYSLTLNGAARTPVIKVPLPALLDASHTFLFGAEKESVGVNAFMVLISIPALEGPEIKVTDEGAQFLDLESLNLPNLKFVRLNTQFAKKLTKTAERSLESTFSWETQHTLEPPAPDSLTKEWLPVDLNGANGRYFWEIFFHVPHMVAHRLHMEFDYREAEKWLNYIFNPLVRIPALDPPIVPDPHYQYWTSRPLTGPDTPEFELEGLGDPDAIAYSVPSHYRKMIFISYLNNIIAHGDMLYRQLTRDTLNEAKLHYVRALSLLGPLSKGRSVSQWESMTLDDAARNGSDSTPVFATRLWQDSPGRLSAIAKGQPWLRLLNAPWFRLPVNAALLDQWERLDLRLSNLRNNLTLDGKPLQLALYEPPANPFDLLRAQLAGGGSAQRRLGSLAIIPPYRFRAMLPRVQNAVETLIRYGDQVRSYMEMRDRANQEELQQSHVLELSTFTQQLQEQALDQAYKSNEALQASRETIRARLKYYSMLVKDDVSSAETAGMILNAVTGVLHTGASLASVAGHIIDMTPNIFGPPIIQGGARLSGGPFAMAAGLQAVAQVTSLASDLVMTTEYYRRRRVEWTFQVEQAELELETIDKQLELQTLAIQSAETSQAQAIKAQEQAQVYYSFLKNRATGPALYQWLLSQMATMYFQAYDVVLSMCLSTEACWQYEIGDHNTHFVPTNAWADNYHGLTAGEALKLGLLRMESSYLNRHERRLELTKTVSLKKLFELKTKDAPEGVKWQTVLDTFFSDEGSGTLPFNLTALIFDQDYPGHYLRQLVNVSVSIPAVIGPYQDIRATLTQLGSRTLTKPVFGGVKWLYQSDSTLPEGYDDEVPVDGTQVINNPRAYQQIGISHGVDDRGMFSMDFGDERYYPFEGTGAVSSWQLHFPRHRSSEQAAMLASLTDIIVHVRYLAVDGGIPFQEQVEALVKAIETPPDAPVTNKRLSAPK